jgi:hypothetical protein
MILAKQPGQDLKSIDDLLNYFTTSADLSVLSRFLL